MVDKQVTLDECERNHTGTRRLFGVSMLLMTLILVVVGWALAIAREASGDANLADQKIDIHQARQNGSLQRIDEHLQRIDERLGRIEEQP